MILCVVGPTGVGKTKMSIELAKKYKAIIINCDATQVYKELNIGSAKATEEEKEGIPHYLLDFKELNEDYTIYDYQKDVRNILDNNKDKNIIFVGGTGLYLKAALYDYRFTEEENNVNKYDNLSNEELYQLVKKKNPNTEIHQNNRQRLIRFLNKKEIVLAPPKSLYKHLIIGLTTSRDNLYQIINNRVDTMFKNGLLEEAENLYKKDKTSKPLQNAIGYKELYRYFNKEISLDEAIELIKKNSRHYAKRQYTFFNNQLDVNWFNVNYSDFNKTIREVEQFIEENYNDKSR